MYFTYLRSYHTRYSGGERYRGEAMQRRKLGQSALTVSAMGLGCMGISHAYGTRDDGESLKTIRQALELGIDFLDTADMYGAGLYEESGGRAITRFPHKTLLAT